MTGKTNLDQFATGLNGTRSPYGAPRSVFDADYVSGGSSSGSAVAVAAGLACFSLGTDTAGSGRVPAAFNNLVGIKPTPGALSTSGLVPACRSLDCITVFAGSVGDGLAVRRIADWPASWKVVLPKVWLRAMWRTLSWDGRSIRLKRLSPSCDKLMFWSRKVARLPKQSAPSR